MHRSKLRVLIFIIISTLAFLPAANAELVCSVVSSCAYTDILHLSSTGNAHAELPSGTNYDNKLCCFDTEGITIGASCSGNYYKFLKLSGSTNAHVEKITESNYAYDVCISASLGNMTCTYSTSCYGYDTCVATIPSIESGSNTNLHIADCDSNPYITKICCTTTGGVIENYITFEMGFNISGNANDEAFVDTYNTGYYTDLNKKYACVQDRSVSGEPAFGLAFGGRVFNYINLTAGNSYKMKLSQYERGNKFIIPATINNCTTVSNKMPLGDIVQTFVKFLSKISTVELSLSYPAIDIEGSFQRTGSVSMVIEKNETNERQIVISPVI